MGLKYILIIIFFFNKSLKRRNDWRSSFKKNNKWFRSYFKYYDFVIIIRLIIDFKLN